MTSIFTGKLWETYIYHKLQDHLKLFLEFEGKHGFRGSLCPLPKMVTIDVTVLAIGSLILFLTCTLEAITDNEMFSIIFVNVYVYVLQNRKTLDELVIRLGEWDAQNDNEQFAHQDRKVSKILTHEEFYNQDNDHHNDIALVIVDRPFELGPNVGTICLPSQDFKFEKNKCYVAGWEKKAFGESYQS